MFKHHTLTFIFFVLNIFFLFFVCQESRGSSSTNATESVLYLLAADDNDSQLVKVDLRVDEGNAGLTPHFTIKILEPFSANDYYAYFYNLGEDRDLEIEYKNNLCDLLKNENNVPDLYKKVGAIVFPDNQDDCNIKVSSYELPNLVPYDTTEDSLVELRVYSKETIGNRSEDTLGDNDSILTVVYLLCKDKKHLDTCLRPIINNRKTSMYIKQPYL